MIGVSIPILGRFGGHRLAMISLGLIAALGLAVLAAPWIAAWTGASAIDVDLFGRFQGSSATHPLGTDELGRDVLLRLLYGGRVSLFVGIVAAFAAAGLGTLIGLTAGYFGGWLDGFLMRLADGIIALPTLPLLIVLAALDLEKIGLPQDLVQSENASLWRIVIIVALLGWTTVARLVRGATLALRARLFVVAAQALGTAPLRIMVRHVLPNLTTPIIVATTLAIGNVILLESVLSFLGLGIQPPVPSWGNLLTNAQELIWASPALAFYPGCLIFATVIAFNFLGDGLQDALDPKAKTD